MLRQKSGEDGIVTVEFVLISFPLILLLLCMADFGHAFLMKQAITSAAREGARYGAVYDGTFLPSPPYMPEQSVINAVEVYLRPFDITPDKANLVVMAPFPSVVKTGNPRTVTVLATKTWYVLDFILKPTRMEATSTMRLE